MQVRDAVEADMREIYMMGFDAWSDGSTEADYLVGCLSSPKYKQGKWKVLVSEEKLCSSLIVYQLGQGWHGIGSVATHDSLRSRGFAKHLINAVSEELESKSKAPAIFLFADINPEFYESLGFVQLPMSLQKYDSSKCMIKSADPAQIWSSPGFVAPQYF